MVPQNRRLHLATELDYVRCRRLPARPPGSWRRDDAVNPAGQMVCVVCITDQQKVAGILDAVHGLLARQIGIPSVCDVEVIRQEHF